MYTLVTLECVYGTRGQPRVHDGKHVLARPPQDHGLGRRVFMITVSL